MADLGKSVQPSLTRSFLLQTIRHYLLRDELNCINSLMDVQVAGAL